MQPHRLRIDGDKHASRLVPGDLTKEKRERRARRLSRGAPVHDPNRRTRRVHVAMSQQNVAASTRFQGPRGETDRPSEPDAEQSWNQPRIERHPLRRSDAIGETAGELIAGSPQDSRRGRVASPTDLSEAILTADGCSARRTAHAMGCCPYTPTVTRRAFGMRPGAFRRGVR